MITIKHEINATHWCFLSKLTPRKKWLKKFFYNFIIIIIFLMSLFKFITRSSSLLLEDMKLLAIVNCIFHVSEFLRFLEDMLQLAGVYFYHRCFYVQYKCYSVNYRLLLVYNNLILCISCFIFLIILSLIALFPILA